MARHVLHEICDGSFVRCVFYTTRTYSNTTAKHLHMVRMSIPPDMQVFHVSNVGQSVEDAYLELRSRVRNLEADVRGSRRKPTRLIAYRSYRAALRHCLDFAAFFGLDDGQYPMLVQPEDFAEYDGQLAEYEANLRVKQIARDAVRQRRWEEQRILWEKTQQQVLSFDPETDLPAWRRGERSTIPYNVGPFFRIREESIESNKGANFPISHARRLLAFVEIMIEAEKEWVADPRSPRRLGFYTIDRIGADGSIDAGCHHVSPEEVRNLIEMVRTAYPHHPDPEVEKDVSELIAEMHRPQ